MIVLIKLILAHFLGDFLLQPRSWVKEKEIKKIASPKFIFHVGVHGVLILVLLWNFKFWPLALLLMGIHGAIDLFKLYFQKETNKSKWFLIDQILHLLSIVVIWYMWFEPSIDFTQWMKNSTVWILITAVLFLSRVSGIIIQVIMTPWSKMIEDHKNDSLQNAGKYIGILERLFVFVFIVSGNWEAIGFLLAAKSVFRFGDLRESKDRKLTEYILIGTLLSFAIAVGTSLLVLALW